MNFYPKMVSNKGIFGQIVLICENPPIPPLIRFGGYFNIWSVISKVEPTPFKNPGYAPEVKTVVTRSSENISTL